MLKKTGPAEKGGLQAEDIIIAIDGHEVKTIEELNSYKEENYDIGDTVTLTVYRDGKEIEVKITLAEQPQETDDTSNNKDNSNDSSSKNIAALFVILL